MSGIEIADICVHTLDQGQLTTTDYNLHVFSCCLYHY